MVMSAYTWDTSSLPRTLAVLVNQYEYPGASDTTGSKHQVSVSRIVTPDNDAVNGLVTIGELTLPVSDIPPENNDAYFALCIESNWLSRVDFGCGTTSGSSTVTDPSAVAGDVGQVIQGGTGDIPYATTIVSATPGVGYVMSASATATSSEEFVIGGGTTGDRFLDFITLDTQGQTTLVNIPGAFGYDQYYIDQPSSDRDLGRVLGSVSDRSKATSVLASAMVSGGPPVVDPGSNPLFVYGGKQGVPGLIATYNPRWWIDRIL
jgi:hypothetical protein